MKHEESRLQVACVRWFRLEYRRYAGLLNSVPNGLLTSASQARIAVAEGLTKGVADLELNIARGGFHGLKIEMKQDTSEWRGGKEIRKKTYQSQEQKEWQKLVEGEGYKYVVCRTLDEFMKEVTGYLGTSDKGGANVIQK